MRRRSPAGPFAHTRASVTAFAVAHARILATAIRPRLAHTAYAFTVCMVFAIGVRLAALVILGSRTCRHINDRITCRHAGSMHIAIAFDDPALFGRYDWNARVRRITRPSRRCRRRRVDRHDRRGITRRRRLRSTRTTGQTESNQNGKAQRVTMVHVADAITGSGQRAACLFSTKIRNLSGVSNA